jgi:hypothetical protein
VAALIALLGWASVALAGDPSVDPQLKRYETSYYIMHTDLDLDGAREAFIRMDAMAEEYHRRTRGFGGTIRRKLAFYLYRKKGDYIADGAPAGSAGVFIRDHRGARLMAHAGEKTSARTWSVVQHEGFHQFVAAAMGGNIPIWANEGMAEYFGEALFTGDGFVVGVVPARRLRRLKASLQGGKLRPAREMMALSLEQWNSSLSVANYDQAWSMIHFLVHADDGKYTKALEGFLRNISRGMGYERSWVSQFGRDIDAFEKRYKQWWLQQPANPSAKLYDQAAAAVLTSVFARAVSQGQEFETAEAFFKAAKAREVKSHRLDWLPRYLVEGALAKAGELGEWSIQTPPRGRPRLVCRLEDGSALVGKYKLTRDQRVESASVELLAKDENAAGKPPRSPATPDKKPDAPVRSVRPAPDVAQPPAQPKADPVAKAIRMARMLKASEMKARAREVLLEAMEEHPDSPHADEALKLLGEL